MRLKSYKYNFRQKNTLDFSKDSRLFKKTYNNCKHSSMTSFVNTNSLFLSSFMYKLPFYPLFLLPSILVLFHKNHLAFFLLPIEEGPVYHHL